MLRPKEKRVVICCLLNYSASIICSPCVGVEVYKSKTTAWIFKESEWGEGIVLRSKSRSVFLNGFMHKLEYSVIVVVDMEEKTWRIIRKSHGAEMSIHQAQGHMCVLC
jgi:hypothetical protein